MKTLVLAFVVAFTSALSIRVQADIIVYANQYQDVNEAGFFTQDPKEVAFLLARALLIDDNGNLRGDVRLKSGQFKILQLKNVTGANQVTTKSYYVEADFAGLNNPVRFTFTIAPRFSFIEGTGVITHRKRTPLYARFTINEKASAETLMDGFMKALRMELNSSSTRSPKEKLANVELIPGQKPKLLRYWEENFERHFRLLLPTANGGPLMIYLNYNVADRTVDHPFKWGTVRPLEQNMPNDRSTLVKSAREAIAAEHAKRKGMNFSLPSQWQGIRNIKIERVRKADSMAFVSFEAHNGAKHREISGEYGETNYEKYYSWTRYWVQMSWVLPHADSAQPEFEISDYGVGALPCEGDLVR